MSETALEGGCHCRICQLTMGSPAGIYASVTRSDFRYTAGTPLTYRATERATREFCGICGAQVVFRSTGSERLSVNLVTLDHPSRIEPTLHIWITADLPSLRRTAHDHIKGK